MKLHETITNFYLKCLKPLFSIEILTEGNRWNKIESVNITDKQFFYRISTETTELLCTENHILINEFGEEIKAIDAKGQKVKTQNGIEEVQSVEKTEIFDNAFDVSLADNTDHLYYANKILSHNCVIADEFSFVPNNIASKVFESIYPVISSSKNSQFIIVSTPNGADSHNLYYEIWKKATSNSEAANVEGWKAFRFDWWDVPGRDEQWKKNTIASIGQQRFDQEFGNQFLASDTVKKLIPEDIIEGFRKKRDEQKALSPAQVEGLHPTLFNQQLKKTYAFTIWHEFKKDHTYIASGDCAEGIGGDNSVLYVWDITDLENIVQCAKFASNLVSPIEFAYVTSQILKLYNNPYYICERNGVGSGYLDALRITYEYPSIVREGKNRDYGVFSHITVKQRACIWAREMATTAGFGWTFYDKDLLDEMETYCKKENRGVHQVYQAVEPAHDDHVMAWIWACYALQPEIIGKYYVCVTTFTSQFDKIYPKRVEPLVIYKAKEIDDVYNDPIYKQFLDFKKEMIQKLQMTQLQEDKNSQDPYFSQMSRRRDPYFNDFDDGLSWNVRGNFSRQADLHANNAPPPFFIV